MKILHVIHSMETGGAEKLVAMLCRFQRDLGHTAEVHCLSTVGPLGEELRADGFQVCVHTAPNPRRKMLLLFRLFRRSRPDVVHCHNRGATTLAAIPAQLAGVPTVLATRHDLVRPPHKWRRELKFAVATRACDRIVAVCEATRRNLLSAHLTPADHTVCIYNGTPAPLAPQLGFPGPERKGRFVLAHVGRLVPAKDQKTLLKAVGVARRRLPQVALWLVGDGPLDTQLRQLTESLDLTKAVTFFGSQTEVAPFLFNADAFVMSSVSEGLPISLLEAMAVGLPTIVTDVGGMAEAVRLGSSGPVVPCSDPDALADAIVHAATAPDMLLRWREAARRCYLERFQPEIMVREYLHLYSKSDPI